MWQDLPTYITPYILDVGFFRLHWYGLMYIVAFVIVIVLVLYRIRTEDIPISKERALDYLVWAIIGVLVGGRLGYVLFYDPLHFLFHPLEIFLPFRFSNGFQLTGISGMSYHGGLIGVILVTWWFAKKYQVHLGRLIDLFLPAVPLGYLFGRLGNFINGELYGRATESFLGMRFASDPAILRHPSQLYEAFFEGLVLFVLLWLLRKKKALRGHLLSIYILGYGLVRFCIEFVREPDSQLGFVLGPFTMGQVLSLIMVFAATFLLAKNIRIGYVKKH